MSAMMAVSDENSITQESSPTSISEPSQPVSNQNSSSTTAGELPQDNPALTQAFSRTLEESLPGIFAAVRGYPVVSPPSRFAPSRFAPKSIRPKSFRPQVITCQFVFVRIPQNLLNIR
jgi:hypothetical protein